MGFEWGLKLFSLQIVSIRELSKSKEQSTVERQSYELFRVTNCSELRTVQLSEHQMFSEYHDGHISNDI